MSKGIRIVKPDELENAVFFTEGDSLQQNLCRISKKAVERKIKLMTLLCSQLVIPSTHVLESDITRGIFLENPCLLERRIFAPSMRMGEISFQDVVLSKRDDSSFYFNYKEPALRAAVETLDGALRIAVVRDFKQQSTHFQRSVALDLLKDDSPLVRRMRIGKSTRQELARKIEELPRFSRDDIAILSQKLSRRARRALVRHTNALYYLYGARWNGSDPEVHPSSIPIYQDKFNQVITLYSERLFVAVIRGLGLRQDLLDKFSIQDVIQLRDEEPVRRFRRAYLNLLEEVRSGDAEKVRDLVETSKGEPVRLDDRTLESSILEALGRKVTDEHQRIEKREFIKRWWSITSFSTTLLSAIGGIAVPPAAGVAATVGSMSALAGAINTFTGLTDPLIDYLFKLQSTEFLLFAAHVVQSRKSTFE